MKRNPVRVALPFFVLGTATVALAQDAPSISPPQVRPTPPRVAARQQARPINVRSITQLLGDVDARVAAQQARSLRERAVCINRLADRIDQSARGLDTGSNEDRRDEHNDQVDELFNAAGDCGFDEVSDEALPTAALAIQSPRVSTGCADGQAGCDKTFNQASFSELLEDSREDFQACYESGLEQKSSLTGTTRLRVKLGAGDTEGEINDIRVERDTLDDATVLRCEADVIHGIDFPPEAQGKTLRFALQHKHGTPTAPSQHINFAQPPRPISLRPENPIDY